MLKTLLLGAALASSVFAQSVCVQAGLGSCVPVSLKPGVVLSQDKATGGWVLGIDPVIITVLQGPQGSVGAPGAAGPQGPKGDPGPGVNLPGASVQINIVQRPHPWFNAQPDSLPVKGASFGSYTVVSTQSDGVGVIWEVSVDGLLKSEGRDYDVIGTSVCPKSVWSGIVDIRYYGK